MEIELVYPPGATPLSQDELAGLLPDHIGTQGELNAWEQQNILEGLQRLAAKGPGDILSPHGIRLIHSRMFDKTWSWAGKYRLSDKNIGAEWAQIPERMQVLCDDVKYQVDHNAYGIDETAARLHHRLVALHPFSNGNGRCARQVADMLLESKGHKPFTWGRVSLVEAGEARNKYIGALRAADAGEYHPLLDFVRT